MRRLVCLVFIPLCKNRAGCESREGFLAKAKRPSGPQRRIGAPWPRSSAPSARTSRDTSRDTSGETFSPTAPRFNIPLALRANSVGDELDPAAGPPGTRPKSSSILFNGKICEEPTISKFGIRCRLPREGVKDRDPMRRGPVPFHCLDSVEFTRRTCR